jgi:carbon-monoxide dehydrogenase small subunit
MKIKFRLNGRDVEADVHPSETLLETIRDRFEITSPKGACTQGVCGLCVVLVDGEPLKSCLVLTPEVQDSTVTTLEGIKDERIETVRESFVEKHGFQCGFCTPAFILRTYTLLGRKLSREEIREELKGTLCRCTGYKAIVDSVEEALIKVRE